MLIVDWRRRTSQVENHLRIDVKRLPDVMGLEVKPRIARRILEIRQVTRHEIVDANDLEAFGQ
jgi:hypothetical protein